MMMTQKKIGEIKTKIFKLVIFSLIQSVILLIALTCIYFFVALPAIKNLWNDIIGYSDETIKNIATKIRANSQSDTLRENPTENPTTTPTATGSTTINQSAFDINADVTQHNEELKSRATTVSLIIGLSIIISVSIIVYFSEYHFLDIIYTPLMGFFIVAITYSTFSTMFIAKYNNLNTNKAIQHYLVLINNILNPNDQMEDIYKQ